MAKYLAADTLKQLDEYRKRIFAEREEAYAKYGIDLLDTDTLSSLSIYQIVSQYDPAYNINFSRNGEDAISNDTLIEQKCSKIKKPTLQASFMFHAMGDIMHPRYVFVVRREDNLKLLRIYDIELPANVELVQQHLLGERNAWLEKGRLDESKMKRDVITVTEKILKEKINFAESITINDCQVFRA